MNDLLTIGKIRTTHGVKGYLKVISFSGEYSHFHRLERIILKLNRKNVEYAVETIKPFGSEVLLKLEGVDSPEAGKALSNAEILVSREYALPLEADEYYLADMIGLDVYTDTGTIGRVKAVCDGGGGELLEVLRSDGSLVYIPFREGFVGDVDIVSKGIELTADWLLE